MVELDSIFHDEFKSNPSLPWVTLDTGAKAGEVRFAGGEGKTAGNVTFVKVYDAGYASII